MTWSQQRAWKPVAWAKKATGAAGAAGHSKRASSRPLACTRDSFTGRMEQVLNGQAAGASVGVPEWGIVGRADLPRRLEGTKGHEPTREGIDVRGEWVEAGES